ncbi:MAG: ParB/RepB/Spo0J family partition protein [Patescibacteria group bacterium]
MKHNHTLGRGLASLIPMKQVAGVTTAQLAREKEEAIHELPIGDIQANPMQPRTHFDSNAGQELVDSIKEHGIIQPLVVSKNGDKYQLIAGERRLRAAKIVGLDTVPAVLRNVSQQQKLEVSLIENIQRQDLNPIEEALAYIRLIDEFGLTQEQMAKRVGKNRTTVANLLRILELPEEVQKALIDRRITVGHAKVILSLDSEKDQLNTFKKILRGGLNVQETTRVVHTLKPPKKNATIDFALQDKEEKLRTALSTKVKIEQRGTKGKIIIEYYSSDELDSLINKII